MTSDQYQAKLNLSIWELDFWGRVRNLTEAALESYLATEEARQAVVISLVAQVANTYLLERELDEMLRLHNTQLPPGRNPIASRKATIRGGILHPNWMPFRLKHC